MVLEARSIDLVVLPLDLSFDCLPPSLPLPPLFPPPLPPPFPPNLPSLADNSDTAELVAAGQEKWCSCDSYRQTDKKRAVALGLRLRGSIDYAVTGLSPVIPTELYTETLEIR
jgi:hypothetical protein